MLGQPVDTLPVVADFRWNRLASESPILASLLWWLALSVVGWAAWPLLFPLLGGLQDRGYGLARTAGWLLAGWVHWMAVSLGLWQNRLAPLALICAGLILAGAGAWWIQRRRIGAFLATRRRLLLGEEGLFALAFLAFVGIRILNPDLWQPWNGGEKFMESAFLNAILRSPHFPPYDPYFAGGSLNYYYFGLYLVSIPIKLTGIAPEVAYNLAVPGLFALTAVGIFSVGHTLAAGGRRMTEDGGRRTEDGIPGRPVIAGLLAVVLALLMGNLDALSQFIEQLRSRLAGMAAPGFDYWASSRVIPETINEFPFWTFLFADLHPHLIAMPFGILVAGLAVNWVLEAGSWKLEIGSERNRRLLRVSLSVCLLILALGAMGAINTWDLPTYTLLVTGALLIAAWRSRRVWIMLASIALSAGIGAAAVIAYAPFYVHYQSQFGDQTGPLLDRYLGWVRAASSLMPWLTVWGIPLFLSLSALAGLWLARRGNEEGAAQARNVAHSATDEPVLEASACIDDFDSVASDGIAEGAATLSRDEIADDGALGQDVAGVLDQTTQDVVESSSQARPRLRLLGVLAWIGLVLLLVALDRTTAGLMLLLLGMALPIVFARSAPPEDNLLALLLALGAGVVAGTELVFLRDFLAGGDWYRMNTLFKFSVPAWLLLGTACGVMLPRLWHELSRLPAWVAALWRSALVLAVLAGLLFLPLGVPARVQDRFPGARPPIGTLNGMDYMTVGRLAWPDANHEIDLAYDYLAIRWLLDHVTGTPVVAEAPAGGYTVDGQSVTADYYRAGGLRAASFTGLPTFVGQHQYEQRPGDQVGQRTQLGQEFFETTDIGRTRELMRQLRVGYIYVGPLERMLFQPESLRKFDTLVEQGELETAYRNQQVTIYRVTR
jgi:uncharacterized membrane protein